MLNDIKKIEERISQLETDMQNPQIVTDAKKMSQLGKEYTEAKEILALSQELENLEKELASAQEILADDSDREMIELAELDIFAIEEKIKEKKR